MKTPKLPKGLTPQEVREWFARLHWRWDHEKARAIGKALARIPANVRAVKLIERTRPAVSYIITRDTYPQDARYGGGPWRATRFDELGASGHFNGNTVEEIIRSLNGQNTPSIGLPHGRTGQFFVHSAR